MGGIFKRGKPEESMRLRNYLRYIENYFRTIYHPSRFRPLTPGKKAFFPPNPVITDFFFRCDCVGTGIETKSFSSTGAI